MILNATTLQPAPGSMRPNMPGGVLAIGDYGLCITLAAGVSPTASLHFVPCAAAAAEREFLRHPAMSVGLPAVLLCR
jgi:hypothetical protein